MAPLYSAQLLDHFQNPRHAGLPSAPRHVAALAAGAVRALSRAPDR
ncbi:MAG: hypothetical protein KJZ84_17260 [Bryobacteraceae bacterium]|nr:hypothetical protein [Bryobacteraceae bacterium]